VSFLALAVVLTALASPSIRAETENSHALNEGIIVLMDLSKSMTVADIGIDRLTLARSAALAISKGADARPLALIVYAGDAYLAQPFSLDRRAFDTFVNSLDRG
jgi:Ca-activated chloride channel family protein